MSKKIGFTALVMTALLILFPSVALSGARFGIDIWASRVVPSLLPFMMVSGILINGGMLGGFADICSPLARRLDVPTAASQSMAVGMLSGYPVGAGMTAVMYRQGKISREQAEKTAALSSFCSPVFILSTVGAGLMKNSSAAIIILAAHYASFFAALPLLRLLAPNEKLGTVQQDCSSAITASVGAILKLSVENAVKTILTVGGYTVLFSIIIEFIFQCGIFPENEYIRCAVSMLLEMSNGCADICASSAPFALKTAMLCFCTTWGGLCVQLQINGYVSECGAKGLRLMLFKLIQAALSALFGFVCSGFVNEGNGIEETFAAGYVQSCEAVTAVCVAIFVMLCIIIPFAVRLYKRR